MRKIMYYMVFIINLISIFFCFCNLGNLDNELVLLPLVILGLFEIFMILKKNNIIKLNPTKKMILMSIILCILFFIMLPLSSCLNRLFLFSDIFIISFIFKFVFIISLFLSLFIIFLLIFSFDYKYTNGDNKRLRLVIMIIITVISLIFIGSTSTGFYDYDFPGIWQSGHGWSNWHPFAFEFLIYFCKINFNNPYLVIILNFLLYIYFCNYALKILDRETHNSKNLILFLLINLIVIVGFDQLRYIKKDVLFALGYCNLILTLADYISGNKFTKQIIINLIIFSMITIIFRHGSSILLIFIFLIMIVTILLKKHYIGILYISLAILSSFGLNYAINYIGFNVLQGAKYPKCVVYTVPIYQIGAFINAGYEFSDSEKEYLEQYLPLEYMKENFQKYNGDALSRVLSPPYEQQVLEFDYEGLIEVNYHMFIKKPILYVRTLLDLCNILWKIERDNWEWQAFFYRYEWSQDDYEVVDVPIEQKETFINKIVDPFVNIFLKSFLFDLRIRGAFPLFMLILSSLILINKKQYKFLIPVICILFWYACLFLSLPMGMTRYCLPFINIYPFIFCLAIGTGNQNK